MRAEGKSKKVKVKSKNCQLFSGHDIIINTETRNICNKLQIAALKRIREANFSSFWQIE